MIEGGGISPELTKRPSQEGLGGVPQRELAHAARIGAPMGEPASAAHRVSEEITKVGGEEYRLEFQIAEATKRIEGLREANPRIVRLATKIIRGFGERLTRIGERMQENSRRQVEAAQRHVDAALNARAKLLERQQEQREGEIAQALLNSMPSWLSQRLIVREGRGESVIEKVKRLVTERYHEFLAGLNTRKAERNARLGEYYIFAGQSLEKVAEGIIERWHKQKSARLQELGEVAEGERSRLNEIQKRMDALRRQFDRLTTKGPAQAKWASAAIEEAPTAQEQRQIMNKLEERISSY